jgi:hypothetical protein
MKMFKPGDRVRLYSGRDAGTVEQVHADARRILVRWDTGRLGSWPAHALGRLDDEAPPEDTPMALDAEAWEDDA